jgi:uncharacterized protein (DUF983 family)
MDPSTPHQLQVTPTRLIVRGLLHECPVCGKHGVIVRWFGLVDRCPTCSFKFERVEGHHVGYLGLNVIVTFTTTFLVLLIGSVLMAPDIEPVPLLVAAIIPAVILPIVFLPSSRTLWTAIDLIMRPLEPGEADPRYIAVDPARDHPTAG